MRDERWIGKRERREVDREKGEAARRGGRWG